MAGAVMHFFRFLVRPTEKNEEYGEVGGAYANCWVREENLAERDGLCVVLHKWPIDGEEE
jgi:hypothetical protein